MADRGAYIAACLTICRAYIVAGRPDRAAANRLVQRVVGHGAFGAGVAGEADPVKSMDTSKAEDPETGGAADMLHEWKDMFGAGAGNGATLQEVIDRCERTFNGEAASADYITRGLRAAVLAIMPDHHRQKPNLTSLGFWMRSKKDRRAGGMWFNKMANSHGPNTWWVEV